MKIFLDTSAFVKLYVREVKTDEVLGLLAHADTLVLSVICLPEIISSLSRLCREGSLENRDYLAIKSKILAHMEDILIVQITPEVVLSSTELLEGNQLRAMDAIHIACAKTLGVDLFVSADHRQLRAADQCGLKTADVS